MERIVTSQARGRATSSPQRVHSRAPRARTRQGGRRSESRDAGISTHDARPRHGGLSDSSDAEVSSTAAQHGGYRVSSDGRFHRISISERLGRSDAEVSSTAAQHGGRTASRGERYATR